MQYQATNPQEDTDHLQTEHLGHHLPQNVELERENRYRQVEQCLLQMEASEMQEEIDEYRKQLTQYEEEVRELRDYIQ